MSKLVVKETHTNPARPEEGIVGMETRVEEYPTFQLAAHQFGLAMDYWANRGSILKQGEKKFTCTVSPDFWVTIELV